MFQANPLGFSLRKKNFDFFENQVRAQEESLATNTDVGIINIWLKLWRGNAYKGLKGQ